MPEHLNLLLDPIAARSLARRAGTVTSTPSLRQSERLVFLDTSDDALLRAGIALVLVGRGRAWVHRLAVASAGARPSSPSPVEWPAPGGRVDLSALPDPRLRKHLTRLAAKSPIGPVGEVSVRRTVWIFADGVRIISDRMALAGPDGTGLVLIHAAFVPASDAALAAAAALVPAAGQRLGALPPELAARSALHQPPAQTPEVRHARAVPLAQELTAKAAAFAVLRECTAQVRANVAAVRAGAGSEGAHQLRVGLRRLRAALGLFSRAIGSPEADRLAAEARWLAGAVGVLRDLDVMREDVVGPEAAAHPDEPGFLQLADALRKRGDRVRNDLNRTLAGDRVQAFLVDLVAFTERDVWRSADNADTAHTAAKSGASAMDVGVAALDRRWRKVRRMAREFDRMDTEARHDLRKELKKLRYGAEFLGPLFPQARVLAFVQRLKSLQEVFGALNDAATAAALLSGPEAPAASDPSAARAAGRVIGVRIARAEHEWADAQALWRKLERTRPFWDVPG